MEELTTFGNNWKPPLHQSVKTNKHVKYVIQREARMYEKEIQKKKEATQKLYDQILQLKIKTIPRIMLQFTMLYDDLSPKLRTNLINLD